MRKLTRCPWGDSSRPYYAAYHDNDWGVQVRDDRTQFEFLILEGAQAGLSWSTILNKRQAYRKAFANFDPAKVARFDARKIAAILKDPGVVRNRLKVESAVNNARRFLEVQKEFGSFCEYIWSFVGGRQKVNHWKRLSEIPATSAESDALSADLKKRGFKFVGSTIMYAHMQATGLVNDHLVTCYRHKACAKAPRR